MNISLRQLRTFLALAETGSVSRTAERLHVTQPTVSMQLKEISDAVGVPLYEVISRKVHLTEAGLALADTARAMGGAWEGFEQYVAGVRGMTQGRLRVSLVSTAKYFIPRILGGFCKQFPAIEVSLEVLNRDGVIQRLRDNRDDLYIMSTPPGDMDLNDVVFMANPLALVAPVGHRLTRRKDLTLHDLAEEAFVLRERGSGTRMASDTVFERDRFKPRVRLELGSNEAIKEAVAGGLGLAVLSRHAFREPRSRSGICELNVQGFPIPSQWHIVYPTSKKLLPVAHAFREHLLNLTAAV